ncbi:MAG: NADH-quinone oxidoreductase subunit C, partial [Myxococcota bacterium]
MSQQVVAELQREFPQYILRVHADCGDETVILRRQGLLPIIDFLRAGMEPASGRMDMLVGLCGNEYPERADSFEAVYHLLSSETWKRLRLRVPVSKSRPVLPSLSALYKSANWYERETWDMFGIQFEGHPHLRRLLNPWRKQGHLLRKQVRDVQTMGRDETAVESLGIRSHVRSNGSETVVEHYASSHPATHGL